MGGEGGLNYGINNHAKFYYAIMQNFIFMQNTLVKVIFDQYRTLP